MPVCDITTLSKLTIDSAILEETVRPGRLSQQNNITTAFYYLSINANCFRVPTIYIHWLCLSVKNAIPSFQHSFCFKHQLSPTIKNSKVFQFFYVDD